MDAGSSLNAFGNGGGPFGPGNGILVQEGSVVTVFNIPQFSGADGFSNINAHDNAGSGVILRTGSTLTVSNQAKITSLGNSQFGVLADNATLTLVNSTVTGNSIKDLSSLLVLAQLQTVFGTYGDAAVLVRGTTSICPINCADHFL